MDAVRAGPMPAGTAAEGRPLCPVTRLSIINGTAASGSLNTPDPGRWQHERTETLCCSQTCTQTHKAAQTCTQTYSNTCEPAQMQERMDVGMYRNAHKHTTMHSNICQACTKPVSAHECAQHPRLHQHKATQSNNHKLAPQQIACFIAVHRSPSRSFSVKMFLSV